MKGKIKRYLETNENGHTTYPNLWHVAIAVLMGKFLAMQAYLRKQEKSHINNLTLHQKNLERRINKAQTQ